MESVIGEKDKCFLCGSFGDFYGLERHHVYGGCNRKNSEKYGLCVMLCGGRCHRIGKHSVHMDMTAKHLLQAKIQKIAMQKYNWTENDFRKIFGKSYLFYEEEKNEH